MDQRRSGRAELEWSPPTSVAGDAAAVVWTESDRDTGEGKVWYGPLDGRQAIHELTSGPRIYPGAVALSAGEAHSCALLADAENAAFQVLPRQQ